MIGPLEAERYFNRLLRLCGRPFHPITIRPAVKHAQPSTDIANGRALLLDFILRDYGTVVPQSIFSPKHAIRMLNMPIFFVHGENGVLGLPLAHAATGSCKVLNGRAPAPVGNGDAARIQVRIRVSVS
jgi:hypothetical protein